MYEKYVGNGILRALEELKPYTEKAREKVFGPKDEPATPAKQDIDATSTPKTSAQQTAQPTLKYDYNSKLGIERGVPGAPNRINVVPK